MHVICIFIDMLIECTNAENGNKKYKYFCANINFMNKNWHSKYIYFLKKTSDCKKKSNHTKSIRKNHNKNKS